MSKKSITRRSRATKAAKKVDWRRIDAITDEEIAAGVAADPDAPPLIGPDWIKKAKLIAPADKELISIRVDKDVLDHFRARPRYQTRINQILRLVMEEEKTGHR